MYCYSLAFICQAVFFFCFTFSVVYGQENTVTADDLISLINGMRVAYGNSALTWDASLQACAQNTADTMAQNGMYDHIGNVSGRAASFGYNNGNTSFVTENWSLGPATLASIQSSWADDLHMLPVTSANYCHIGAGVSAPVNGLVYYIVQAGYPAGGNCSYSSSSSSSSTTSGTTVSATLDISQLIAGIVVATPDTSGKTVHEVMQGQTMWTISEAYGTTVNALAEYNGISNTASLSIGQKLLIPVADSSGVIPTADFSETVYPTANAAGQFFHIVEAGDTLYGIADFWDADFNAILTANGLTADSAIGLGWDLEIPITATPRPIPTDTPQPTLTATVTVPAVTETPTAEPQETVAEDQTVESSIIRALKIGIAALVGVGLIVLIIDAVLRNKKKENRR